jgi:adenylate kinase
VVSAPPRREGRCDLCGGELYQRPDDVEATVARRLDVYDQETAPLLEHYRRRGLLVSVPGEGEVARIGALVQRAVGSVA